MRTYGKVHSLDLDTHTYEVALPELTVSTWWTVEGLKEHRQSAMTGLGTAV